MVFDSIFCFLKGDLKKQKQRGALLHLKEWLPLMLCHRPQLCLEKSYEFSSLRMKTFLQAQEHWDTLRNTYVKPTQEEWMTMINNQMDATIKLKRKQNIAQCWI